MWFQPIDVGGFRATDQAPFLLAGDAKQFVAQIALNLFELIDVDFVVGR